MFLKHKHTEDLIEVLTVDTLYNPCRSEIKGQIHAGEEMQDPEMFDKSDLVFPSGEALPRCWVDACYQGGEIKHLANLAVA